MPNDTTLQGQPHKIPSMRLVRATVIFCGLCFALMCLMFVTNLSSNSDKVDKVEDFQKSLQASRFTNTQRACRDTNSEHQALLDFLASFAERPGITDAQKQRTLATVEAARKYFPIETDCGSYAYERVCTGEQKSTEPCMEFAEQRALRRQKDG